jgi:hypothetical protein
MCLAEVERHDNGVRAREIASHNPTESKRAQRRPNLSITSNNCRGFSAKTSIWKRDELAHSMKKHNVDATCLQETWNAEDEDFIIHGYHFFLHGGPSRRGGVGIVLSPKAIKAWERAGQPDPIKSGNVAGRERTISIELHYLDGANQIVKYFLVSSYAPCTKQYDNTEEYKEYLLNLEEKILQKCPADAMPIICIDANAAISDVNSDNCEEASQFPTDIAGKFGVREKSFHGERFMNFLSNNGLCSTGSYFDKPCHLTWIGPNGCRKEIDHILIPRRHLRSTMRFDIVGGLDSDHLMLRIKLRIAAFIPRKKEGEHAKERQDAELPEGRPQKKRIRIDWMKIHNDSQLKEQFNGKLNTLILEKGLSTTDISSWDRSPCFFNTFTELIEQAAQEVAPSDRKKKRPPWFEMSEDQLLEVISIRDMAAVMYMKNPNPSTKEKLSDARKNVKRVVKESRNRWMQIKLDEIENHKDQPRNHWRAAREIVDGYTGHHRKARVTKMRMANGEMASNEEESAKVFKDHFEKNVFNRNEESSYDDTIFDEIDPIPCDPKLGEVANPREIKHAIRKMKTEKAPGKNGLPPEAYKLLNGIGEEVLEKIIIEFWTNPDFNPDVWKHVMLKILPKSGDLSNPNKWRGIALLDICSKAVSSIAATRLANHLKSFGVEEQAGSTPGKGCADATFTLKMALQTLHEHDQESWVLFVDLVKAYDTVNREMLWKILKILGVPDNLIMVLKKLYTDVTINLNVGEILEQFLSTSGVKQGDNLAPILFIFVIHAVSNSLDKKWVFKTPEFRWQPDTLAGNPRGQLIGTKYENIGTIFSFFKSYYVDDTAFILLSRGELIAASKLIVSHFRRFGLTIHTGVKSRNEDSKTEAMHFPRPGQESSAADMEDIEIDEDRFMSFCLKFKYLGTFFTPELNDTADIIERISQARKLFNSMNQQVLSNRKIPMHIRRRLYQAIVANIALWGSESWALKEEDRSKLETFHHNCLRRMCRLTMWDVAEHRITNETVRMTAGNSPTMESMMEVRRCRWLSKLSAMEKSRSPRRMLGAWCPTPRPAGRPQQTIRHGYRTTLSNLGFEHKQGQIREWMTVARDRPTWGTIVESRLGLPPGSFTNLRRQ